MNITDKKMSYFTGGATDTKPNKSITFGEIANLMIKDKDIREKITRIRKLYSSGEPEKAKTEKLKLPYFTPTGIFTQRKDNCFVDGTYNWVCLMDIDYQDNLKVGWVGLKQLIMKDSNVVLCVSSPRGMGLKVIIKLTENKYEPKNQYEIFKNIVYPYYENLWNIKLDYAQGRISQPCFITFDEDGYYNPQATEKDFDYNITNIILDTKQIGDEFTFNSNTILMDLRNLIEKREFEKWAYFGRVAFLAGGYFSGNIFAKIKEEDVVGTLLNGMKANKFVENLKVAETQIRNSFNKGKLTPITKEELKQNTIVKTIIHKLNKQGINQEYLRIGNDYIKKTIFTNFRGEEEPTLLVFKRQTIVDDFGWDFLNEIPKFNAFANVPSNTNYRSVISGNYNLFMPFKHQPIEGQFPTILKMINHVFKEQLEMGLDYIQLLYEKPTEMLPVLCLVSKEQGTGKTTFLDFLSYFFQGNVSIVGTLDIEGQFNSHYITKLIIGIDESDLHKESNTSKIKKMATQKYAFLNEKFLSMHKVDTFGKIILCSNNERSFINIKNEDVRYWIRKLGKPDGFDGNFIENLKIETPHFLHFLQNRELVYKKQSRHWFSLEDLNTTWLEEAKQQGYSQLWHELNNWFLDWFLDNEAEKTIFANLRQLREEILRNDKAYPIKFIAIVMKDEFQIEPKPMKRRCNLDSRYIEKNSHYYAIERDKILSGTNNESFA